MLIFTLTTSASGLISRLIFCILRALSGGLMLFQRTLASPGRHSTSQGWPGSCSVVGRFSRFAGVTLPAPVDAALYQVVLDLARPLFVTNFSSRSGNIPGSLVGTFSNSSSGTWPCPVDAALHKDVLDLARSTIGTNSIFRGGDLTSPVGWCWLKLSIRVADVALSSGRKHWP